MEDDRWRDVWSRKGNEDFLTADFSDDTDTESLNRRSNREIYEIGEGGGGKTLEPQNTQN